jgi:hypothetical protein
MITHNSFACRGGLHQHQGGSSSGNQRWPVIVFANSEVQSTSLSGYEMNELRSMRVEHHEDRARPLALRSKESKDSVVKGRYVRD